MYELLHSSQRIRSHDARLRVIVIVLDLRQNITEQKRLPRKED